MRAALGWRFYVEAVVVRRAILPAPEHDANPFVGESTNGRMMILASQTLLLIVQFRPGAESPCAVGKLMERLEHELRTGQSPMNPYHFTATFRYRRYTRELLNLQS